MISFKEVKQMARDLTTADLRHAKKVAGMQENYGRFWAYEAAQSYAIMLEAYDKLFWWRLTVKEFRYSIDWFTKTTNKNALKSL